MLDLDELMEESQRIAQQSNGNNTLDNFIQMPRGNGYILVRLLPPAKASLFESQENPNPTKPKLYTATRLHKLGKEGSYKNVHCPRELQGTGKNKKWIGECPICSLYSHYWSLSDKQPKESDKQKELIKMATRLRPNERYYYNAVAIEVKDEGKSPVSKKENGPKIWSVGKTIHHSIIRAILGDTEINEEGLGDITDVTGKTGRTMKVISQTKKGNNSDYSEYSCKFLDPTPAADPETIQNWLGKLHDLSQLRKVLPMDKIEHELKVDQGRVEEKSSNSFDPTKFMKGASAAATVTETPASAKPASTKVSVTEDKITEPAASEESTDESGDEALVEDDFLSELKGM